MPEGRLVPHPRLVVVVLTPVALGLLALLWRPATSVLVGVDVLILVVAWLDALSSGVDVAVVRRLPTAVPVGRAVPIQLLLTASRRVWAKITDDAPDLSPAPPGGVWLGPEDTVVPYVWTAVQRGQREFGDVTVRTRSRLGLWWRQISLPVVGSVRVFPDFASLRTYDLRRGLLAQRAPVRTQRRPGGENEFERNRPYVRGDAYRHIDWRATAKRSDLISREFQQESNQNLLFLLDAGRGASATFDGTLAFDHALSASMMLGAVALRHGDRVGMLAYDDKIRAWAPPRAGARSGSRLVRAVYDVFPTLAEPDHMAALRWVDRRVRRRSLIVLVTALTDGVNAEAVRALATGLGRRHVVLVAWLRDPAVDDMAYGDNALEAAAAAEWLAQRESTLRTLRAAGVLVADQPLGALTGALVDRYLEIKARRML